MSWLFFMHVPLPVGAAEPFLGDAFIPLATLLALYWVGVTTLRPKLAAGVEFPREQAWLFTAGIALLYFSLENYYLDVVGERYLFCVHMLQHCIIIFLVPVFLLSGSPDWLIRPLAEMVGVPPILRIVTRPVMTFILFNVIFSIWHLPGLFEFALRDRFVHFLEHACFLTAGILMWWPILSPLPEYPRLGPGPQIVYYFLLSLSQIPLFFLLAFGNTVYYDTYITAPRFPLMGMTITPEQDQQIGGILMKLVGEFAFISGIGVAFFRLCRGQVGKPVPVPVPVEP
ncbi:MAG: cytochrome c oxidase assembly protein [Candidatus Xenobia bacterium]